MKALSFFPLFFSVAVLLFGSQVAAEQKKKLGSWDVHYIAFPATFLTPEVAVEYDIQRSKFNGVVNISVLDRSSQQPLQVAMNGIAKDLFGRQRKLEFNQIVEGEAIYYLATVPYQDEQLYNFTINISHGNQQQQLTFSHTFFVD